MYIISIRVFSFGTYLFHTFSLGFLFAIKFDFTVTPNRLTALEQREDADLHEDTVDDFF